MLLLGMNMESHRSKQMSDPTPPTDCDPNLIYCQTLPTVHRTSLDTMCVVAPTYYSEQHSTEMLNSQDSCNFQTRKLF